jgi:hypothetical protein
MNEKDYLHLIEVMKEQLILANLGHIAADENYLDSPSDFFSEGEEDDQLPEPRKHFDLLFEAFCNHVALNDKTTVETALSKINSLTRNEGPNSVSIQTLRRAGRERADESPLEISLMELPDFTELRKELRRIASDIVDPPKEFGAD